MLPMAIREYPFQVDRSVRIQRTPLFDLLFQRTAPTGVPRRVFDVLSDALKKTIAQRQACRRREASAEYEQTASREIHVLRRSPMVGGEQWSISTIMANRTRTAPTSLVHFSHRNSSPESASCSLVTEDGENLRGFSSRSARDYGCLAGTSPDRYPSTWRLKSMLSFGGFCAWPWPPILRMPGAPVKSLAVTCPDQEVRSNRD